MTRRSAEAESLELWPAASTSGHTGAGHAIGGHATTGRVYQGPGHDATAYWVTCPHCAAETVVDFNGETTCGTCGVIWTGQEQSRAIGAGGRWGEVGGADAVA